MSSRCCTLPLTIFPEGQLAPQRSTWTMDISAKGPVCWSSCLQDFLGKGVTSHRGVCEWYHPRKPRVVPDFLTVSSKIRGKAARKHVCCAIWLSRGAGIGGGVIEGTVSIVSISTPPCGSSWMDNIILAKQYKAWEGLEDQVYLQVHFTAMTLKPPQICFHGRFWPTALVQLRSEVLLHHSTLWHLLSKDKGGLDTQSSSRKTQCCWLLVDNDQPEAFPLNISCYIFVGSQS